MRYWLVGWMLFCLIGGSLFAQSSEVERLSLARQAYENESYLEALDYIRTILRNNPSYGDAYRYLAMVHYALQQYAEAANAAEQALRYNRQDTESMILLANSYREMKEYTKAEKLYQDILKQYPALAAAHRELSLLYVLQNRLSLAYQSVQRALRYDVDDWQNFLILGRYYQAKGDNKNAEAAFAKALQMEPRKRETHFALGDFYFRTGQYEKAVQVLKGAIELFDHFVSGRAVLADAFLALGLFSDALVQYEWLEKEKVYHAPTEEALLAYKMALAYGVKDKEKALSYYQRVQKLAPKDQFYELGYQTYLIQNQEVTNDVRQNEALKVYAQAQRVKLQGDLKLFFVLLRKALLLDPYLKNARMDLIEFYESRGMWSEAYEELQILKRFHYDLKIRDKLARYDWEIARKNIVINKPIMHQYKGYVIFDSDFLNMAEVGQHLLLEYSGFFLKFKFSGGDFRKVESTKELLSLLRAKGYDFFVRVKLHPSRNQVQVEVVDGNASTLAEQVFPFDQKTMRDTVWRIVTWMDGVFPDIYLLKVEQTRRQYVLAAGSLQGVKAGETWIGFERRSLQSVLRLNVKSVNKNESVLEAVMPGSNLDYPEKEDLYFIREKDFTQKDLTKLKFILGY
ncbi:tetratricopeptide repeat protein [Thermospira aquatica]|uniref:Tetratricopeptide repeat protein n=1 Tax=Thermospira aquatica TaxID=2828656 RepID=A0AAX3BB90_9SPIR|nr:tetratricopeptide repeat protein [Thermospira aquatica]URA09500.1 tetratricopeptide repeat protein [Thermospira aquatica]